MRVPAAALCAFVLLELSTTTAPATALDEPTALAVSAGAFDTGGEAIAEAGLELRWRNRLPLGLGLSAGVATNEDEGVWGHLGLRRTVALGASPWRLVPSFAVVAYERGEGKDLGQTLEFRSGLELAWELAGGQRLGALFYHLSNASLADVNPGSNSLVAVFSWPLEGSGN
jgi:hypothetical protein